MTESRQIYNDPAWRRLTDQDGGSIADDNPLPVKASGGGAVVCEGNSFDNKSFAPSENFTGPWVDVLRYSSLTFVINATSISATDGARIEFSDNATDIERVIDATVVGTVQGGEPLSVVMPVQARFFRVSYTNGAGPSTVSLQTIKRIYPMTAAQAPLGAEIGPFSTASITKAVLAGQSDNGDFGQISVDNDGFLRVNLAGQDRRMDIAGLGQVAFTQTNVQTDAGGGPTKLISAPLTGRTSVAIKNPDDARLVFVGTNPALTTTSNSYPVAPGETLSIDLDDTVDLYGLAEVDDVERVTRTEPRFVDGFGDVINPSFAREDDDQFADIGTVAGTDRIELAGYRFDPSDESGIVFDTVEDIRLVVKARRKSTGGTDPQLLLTYEVSGVTGASSRTIDLTSTTQSQFELDITADQAVWLPADISAIKVILTRNNGGQKRAEVDVALLKLTEGVDDGPIRVATIEAAT